MRRITSPLLKLILLMGPIISMFAHAEVTSMRFPEAHGNSTAVAANAKSIVVGTDYGYIEVLDRANGGLKSIQIYRGPYRMTTSVVLDGDIVYAVTSGYSIVKVDLASAQIVDELKVSRDFNDVTSFQLFGSIAFVNGYSGLKPTLFKLDLSQGKLSALKPEIVPLPFSDSVYQLHMTSESTGLAIVGRKLQLAKFDLATQTATTLSLNEGIHKIIAVANDIVLLSGKDRGSEDSRNDVYLALDLQSERFILPLSKSGNSMPVLDFFVNGDSIFIASWKDGLVVQPATAGSAQPQSLAKMGTWEKKTRHQWRI